MVNVLYTLIMNKRRNVITIVSLLGFLLIGFQNCAPSKGGGASSDSANVGVIEDQNKSTLQFVSPTIDVQSEVSSTDLSGFCSRIHGEAHLNWAIWSNQKSEHPVMSGTAQCKSGQFAINVDQLDQMPCGERHVIMVQGDWGGSTHAYVSRRCFPLASQVEPAPAGSPYGTQCAREYVSSSEGSCRRICYRDSKVVFDQAIESSQCSDLMAKVAGP